jgi:two-component system, response regulator RpfG
MMQNIVLVDDDEDHLFLLERMLSRLQEQHPVAIHSFNRAHKALEWCQDNPMSLCFSDFEMPDMDGMEFISALREIPAMDHVPVFMITGVTDSEVHRQARERGATGVFTKPINLVNVLRAVSALLHLDDSQAGIEELQQVSSVQAGS